MIMEKTSLEPKFNQISGAAPGKILKFKHVSNDSDEIELVAVYPYSEGILPQVKVMVPAGYTVTCVPEAREFYSVGNVWYFNLPSLNTAYTFYSGTPSTTPYVNTLTPTEYKQYLINVG